MPQLAPLVLKDRQATPVDHTFNPVGIDAKTGVAQVAESDGTPLGANRISLDPNRGANGRFRRRVKYSFPVVQTETVNGVSRPVVVRVSRVGIDFDFDPASSEAERNDVVGMVASSLETGKTLINGFVVKLEGVY